MFSNLKQINQWNEMVETITELNAELDEFGPSKYNEKPIYLRP